MTKIFGILNITEDSFSDGGQYLAPAAALSHAARLADSADVIDIGAASSHPDGVQVGPAAEIARLKPVVSALQAQGASVSIDSYESKVQRWAMAQGVDWLNDIQGFSDPTLYDELADSSCGLVAMHSVQNAGPATRVDTDAEAVWQGLLRFFEGRLEAFQASGIALGRVVLDPGMGFFLGAQPEPSVRALQRIAALRSTFGLPVLISVSRKSFLRKLTGCDVAGVGPATLAAELFAAQQGAAWIRTHDSRALRDALIITNRLNATA